MGRNTVLTDVPKWFEEGFSTARLAPYRMAAQRHGVSVEDLYTWNLKVAYAFAVGLHCLEVRLRNRVHMQLRNHFANDYWWQLPVVQNAGCKTVRPPRGVGRPLASADDVVARQSFGFWVSLLNKRHDRGLWVPALHKAFPQYQGTRQQLQDEFESMRLFRNRISHHEPIHHRHLAADHQTIIRLLTYLDENMTGWLAGRDDVPKLLAQRPGAL